MVALITGSAGLIGAESVRFFSDKGLDVIGIDKLKIIHVNDSKTEFGSKKDRHEHIGEGHIGLDGFRNFVNDRRLKKVPFILETPKEDDLQEDVENLKKLRSLVNGK